jgi:hypothetical protein
VAVSDHESWAKAGPKTPEADHACIFFIYKAQGVLPTPRPLRCGLGAELYLSARSRTRTTAFVHSVDG